MNTSQSGLALILALASTLLCAVPARAVPLDGLDGRTLTATYRYPNLATEYASSNWTPQTFVVGAGQETAGHIEGVTDLLVDFTADRLTITLQTTLTSPTWNAVAFNGPVFSGTGFDILDAVVNALETTMAGFDDSRVTFSDTNIFVNWGGLSYVDGTKVVVDFSFPDSSSAVPVPATFALLGFGFAGMVVARHRRNG